MLYLMHEVSIIENLVGQWFTYTSTRRGYFKVIIGVLSICRIDMVISDK